MTDPKSTLYETYNGYQIRYRPWRKRRPWRCQVPNSDGRNLWADVDSIAGAHNLIDRGVLQVKMTARLRR